MCEAQDPGFDYLQINVLFSDGGKNDAEMINPQFRTNYI